MANKLVYQVDIDATGFRAGIIQLERLSTAASAKMSATLSSPRVAGGAGLTSVAAALAQAERVAGRPAGMSAEEAAFAATSVALNRNRIQNVEDQERELGRFREMEKEQELKRIAEVENAAQRMKFGAQTASLSAAYYPPFLAQISKQAAEAEAHKLSRLSMVATVAAGAGFSQSLFGGHSLFGGTGPGGGFTGVMRETLVIIRELARHNFSRVAGSATLLAQYMGVLGKVIKSSASEVVGHAIAERKLAQSMAQTALAAEAKAREALRAARADGLSAGAAEESIVAYRQQAAAALQAAEAQKIKAGAATEDAEIAAATSKVTISGFGMIIAAAIAVGGIAYFLYRQFVNFAAAQRNTADLSDLTAKSFHQQAQAMEEAAKTVEAERDRLNELAEAEKGVKDAIDETLKSMREKYQLERQLAEAKGENATTMAAMDIAAQQAEIDFLNTSIAASQKKIEMDKAAEKSASDALAAFEKSDEAIKKKAAEESLAKTLEVIKAYEEALKTKTIPRSVAFTTAGPAFSNYTPATASDRFMLKVGNKEYNTSLDALTKIYDADKAVVEGVTTAQKRLADSLTHLQKTTDKDEEAQSKHKTQLDELNSKMNLDKQYLPQIAALQDRKKIESSIGRSSGDSMVRVGNFLGSAKGAIDSIEQRKVSLLTKIEQNTRPRPMPAHEGSHFAIH